MAELRVRREPPRLRVAEVRRRARLSPHMVRVVVGGPELAGLDPGLPGASVRLLLAAAGADLVMPTWDGNEFLLPDGARPILRTLTPRRVDPDALELTVDVVVHDESPLSVWATTSSPGDPLAVSGTGRGYTIDPDAKHAVLAGDETAIPAMSQLLESFRRPSESMSPSSWPDPTPDSSCRAIRVRSCAGSIAPTERIPATCSSRP